ncbi:MAG: FGGY-family carbohydrate kinase [Oscillospiraceae bacterium]|nr:FGGY-family carbohydrate kinase [Oscillospiraceae bacterium]
MDRMKREGILMDAKQAVIRGETYLGIELGSTRIKAVLIGGDGAILASGAHDWESSPVDGIWTYSLDEVEIGLRACFALLAGDVRSRYGTALTTVGGMGISAMMHGYMAFDENWNQLVPFRTWRNTTTARAADLLTKLLGFNIPQRWGVAHLYQAILNEEPHIGAIAKLTTLAGYVHYRLTGGNVLGVGDASGLFPFDSENFCYNREMMEKFDALAAQKGFNKKLGDILPKHLNAGESAGRLTEAGAKFLDPSGVFEPGVPFCPPEGDAGTGMVATNAVAHSTGNISAGTSIFAMLVLEKPLSKLYTEVDMVTTPGGRPVAMVHAGNCTTDLDAWVSVLGEAAEAVGASFTKSELYDRLYQKALEGDADCGGLLSYNYLSGEHIHGLEEGRPLFVRTPESSFTLANFMRTLLFSAMATLKTGMEILTEKEKVKPINLLGHGGLFKTEGVGQKLMASALGVPVSVMESAGEGGAWGIALLAAYMGEKADGETLDAFLAQKIFARAKSVTEMPDEKTAAGFAEFMKRYATGMAIERAAIEYLKYSC